MKHEANLTPSFPVALIVAVKASLKLDGNRRADGSLDATAITEDMLARRPELDRGLVLAAVQSRLSEDPMHCLA
jgi:hypothetical protein